MESNHLLLIFVFVIIAVVILYFQLSPKKEQLTIVNTDGSKVTVQAEVADTMVKKAKGLMFRESLGENEGMLFLFDSPGIHAFWMVNTSIPLDAIHFSADGKVVDVISMEPCGVFNCPTYPPKVASKYVLEVNQGFAKMHGIKAGVSYLEPLPK